MVNIIIFHNVKEPSDQSRRCAKLYIWIEIGNI